MEEGREREKTSVLQKEVPSRGTGTVAGPRKIYMLLKRGDTSLGMGIERVEPKDGSRTRPKEREWIYMKALIGFC